MGWLVQALDEASPHVSLKWPDNIEAESEVFAVKIFAQNDYINLAYTRPEDIPFVVEAETNPANSTFIGRWPNEQHLDALSDGDILHLVVKNNDGQNVGYVIIRGLENKNDCIELFRIVITQKDSGYGQNVFELVKTWCFEERKAHRLWLDVRPENARAQHVYEKQGFVREGVLRECIKEEGGYKSLILMGLLSREYFGS